VRLAIAQRRDAHFMTHAGAGQPSALGLRASCAKPVGTRQRLSYTTGWANALAG
jgi:hypothetical protein